MRRNSGNVIVYVILIAATLIIGAIGGGEYVRRLYSSETPKLKAKPAADG